MKIIVIMLMTEKILICICTHTDDHRTVNLEAGEFGNGPYLIRTTMYKDTRFRFSRTIFISNSFHSIFTSIDLSNALEILIGTNINEISTHSNSHRNWKEKSPLSNIRCTKSQRKT